MGRHGMGQHGVGVMQTRLEEALDWVERGKWGPRVRLELLTAGVELVGINGQDTLSHTCHNNSLLEAAPSIFIQILFTLS